MDFEKISQFLVGSNDEKYLTAVECNKSTSDVTLVFNIPKTEVKHIYIPYNKYVWVSETKLIAYDKYKPFIWLSEQGANLISQRCGGKERRIFLMNQYGLKIKKLNTKNLDGVHESELDGGYNYLMECTTYDKYDTILKFLYHLNINIYGDEYRGLFLSCSPTEQYLIQKKKRLFKGFEEYENLHKLTFDLETTGLNPEIDSIIIIGVKDNRGFEELIDVKKGCEESEFLAIKKLFDIIDKLTPDVIIGYNSEFFDFNFLVVRSQRCGYDVNQVVKTLSVDDKLIRRNNASLKIGGKSEKYTQTLMFGYNIIDTQHAVRRAKAINSEIEKTSLKYISKFCDVAPPNRVYIKGDNISTIFESKDKYSYNEQTGKYSIINTKNPLKENDIEVDGRFIVFKYLMDDLYETNLIDDQFNQANFLIAKILPTTFSKVCTMGTASIWGLIMMAWSYENGLAIPPTQEKHTFVGGLSRLMVLGYVKDVVKFDFTSLYPTIELAYEIKTKKDITGVMGYLLKYVLDERIKYKDYMKVKQKKKDSMEKELKECENDIDRKVIEKKINKLNKEISIFDKKQLPLKILANSFFGSFGAIDIFNWGDLECAEETTCRGRQSLRLMIKFFSERGFNPLVGDTDGFNFQIPKNVNTHEYISNGNFHKHKKGDVFKGVDAYVAEFNDLYMIEPMGLSVDEYCDATINFSKKNYVDLFPPTKKHPNGKMKKVGNTVKSSTLATYQQEFFDRGLWLLCNGKGYEFINSYYDYIDDIYNRRIPLRKIATKANINQLPNDYVDYIKKTTKSGNLNSRQAHMELVLKSDLIVNLGNTIYYYNTGTKKSQGDVKFNKVNGELTINCEMLSNDVINNDIDTFGDYNTALYINKFNKRLTPLLICFKEEIRDKILIDDPKNRSYFTEVECELVSGVISKTNKSQMTQTSFEDIMTMDDNEIKFWVKVNKTPNFDFVLSKSWGEIVSDYKIREQEKKINEIYQQKKIFIKTLLKIKNDSVVTNKIPKILIDTYDVTERGFFIKNKNILICTTQEYIMFFKLDYNKWVEYLKVKNVSDLPNVITAMSDEEDFEIMKEKFIFINTMLTEEKTIQKSILKNSLNRNLSKNFVIIDNGIYSKLYDVLIISLEDYLNFYENDIFENLEVTHPDLYKAYTHNIINQDEDEELEVLDDEDELND
jgi:DNA polymerase elongation subunit (family B)